MAKLSASDICILLMQIVPLMIQQSKGRMIGNIGQIISDRLYFRYFYSTRQHYFRVYLISENGDEYLTSLELFTNIQDFEEY